MTGRDHHRQSRTLDGASRLPKGLTIADTPAAVRYDPCNPLPAHGVAAGSNKKYWWRCTAGPDHQWEATANSVTASRNGGCPFCAGKRPSVTNRLDILYPVLSEEWDFEKNQGPGEVVAGSEKQVWWRCTQNHSWQANIRNRTILGSGCPHCAARKTSRRMSKPKPGNSLAEVHPLVAEQWHPFRNAALTPGQVAPQSNTAAWWRCAQGHDWQISPAGRIAKGGAGCPFCSGRFATAESSLATRRPEIAVQWHPSLNGSLTPDDVQPSTAKIVWWKCLAGHDYRSKIANRTALGRGCPYCSNQKIGYGNDLMSQMPALATEWHPTKNGDKTPAQVTPGVGRPFWWLCESGHSWQANVASRARLGTGCPKCSAGWRRSRPEIALQCELQALLPALVEGDARVHTSQGQQHVDIIARTLRLVVEYDGNFWHAECEQRDREKTQALIHDGWLIIRVRQAPLPLIGPVDVICAVGDPDPYEMTLQVIDRIAAASSTGPAEHPLTAVSPRIRKAAVLYRMKGHLWAKETAEQMIADSLQGVERSRPVQPPPQPGPGNSLAEKNPAIAAEWHPTLNGGLRPENVANARNARAWWSCGQCGSEWNTTINTRVRRGRPGCPSCNRLASARERARPRAGQSLAEMSPMIAHQWHPSLNDVLSPTDVRPSSHLKVWWQCQSGHEWKSAVYNRTKGKHGCPQCKDQALSSLRP